MIFSSFALLIASAAISNDDKPYYTDANWSVYKNASNCSLVSTYNDNSVLWISYGIGLNKATFIITDPALKSVTSDKFYKLSLYFSKRGTLDDGWGQVDAQGVELDAGNKGIRFVLNGSDAINDIEKSDILGLMREDVVVESLTLRGSAVAVPKLRACARLIHKENPSDPLAGAGSTR